MLRKVIDSFDIDAYGWFDMPSEPGSMGTSHIQALTQPAEDVWSLWVKTPTTFAFDTNTSYTVLDTANNLFGILWQRYRNDPAYNSKTLQRALLHKALFYIQKNHALFSLDDFERAVEDHSDFEKVNDCVVLPNYLLAPRTLEKVGDHYLLADAITGHGLEALEALRQVIPPLCLEGLQTLTLLRSSCNLDPDPATPNLRNRDAVIASCTLDIWWATQIQKIRNHILATWPGWSDIFAAQDTVSLPETDTMQSHVSKKSPTRSDLRRFCMAMAWNLNPHNTRLTFPRSFKSAYDTAVAAWPKILATPDDDGLKLRAISDLVKTLAITLNTDEELNKRFSVNTGSNFNNLDGTISKFRGHILNGKSSVVEAKPTTEEDNSNPIVPGVILPPPDWIRNRCKVYAKDSTECQAKYRKQIADQISASAWFVPNPPPLEHGNLDGQLDEGNLLRYAAFSDPNIFSVRPESGAGQIAIGVLVDSSGSMNRHLDNVPHNLLQLACAFVGGLRDGLARNPNVKVESFAFDSRVLNPSSPCYRGNVGDLYMASGFREDLAACALRRLDTDDDLLNTQPGGGTPTASALFTLDQHLTHMYPEAQRIIIILTDGEPCGGVEHPYMPAVEITRRFFETEDEVRKLVSAIPTPVFCVGIGVDTKTLNRQYNVGHSFAVESPLDAVPIACNLVRGIGQSLNS